MSYDYTNFRVRGVEMPTGRVLWSHFDVVLFAGLETVRSRTGGGDDIVYGRTQTMQEAPRYRSRVDVLRGDTGLPRWVSAPS